MFLFLRKSGSQVATSGFVPKERYSIPSSGKHAIIRLIAPTTIPKCICGGRNIFREISNDSEGSPANKNETKTVGEQSISYWFQAHHTLKGFKDVKINGISASTVWLQSQ